MLFSRFNDIDLSHGMLADCCMRRRREWGTVAAVGQRRPPWLGCIFLPSFHLGTSRVTPKTTLKPTQNQPMSHLISPSIMGGWGRFKRQSSTKTCWLAPATRCRVNYLLLPRHLASNAWSCYFVVSLTALVQCAWPNGSVSDQGYHISNWSEKHVLFNWILCWVGLV